MSRKMLLSEPLGELNIVFQDEFDKNFTTTVNECQILFIILLNPVN